MTTSRHATHTRANMYGIARHAKHYERWAGLLATPLYRRVVADVAAAQLPGGASVLDVGTGPGRVPMMIAEQCPQLSVAGIDLSPEMIARASAGAARGPAGHSVQLSGRRCGRPADRRRVHGSDRVLDQHAPLGRPCGRTTRHRSGAPTRCPGPLDLRLPTDDPARGADDPRLGRRLADRIRADQRLPAQPDRPTRPDPEVRYREVATVRSPPIDESGGR